MEASVPGCRRTIVSSIVKKDLSVGLAIVSGMSDTEPKSMYIEVVEDQ